MEYLNLFKELDESKVKYLICGGLAVNIYGIPRMTADIDLLIDFEPSNTEKFDAIVKKLFYASLVPLELASLSSESKRFEMIKTKNLIAYSYYNTKHSFMNLDVLIDVPSSFEEMWNRREVRHLDRTAINIVSIKDLISMKQYSNRTQDQQDILFLSKLIDNENNSK